MSLRISLHRLLAVCVLALASSTLLATDPSSSRRITRVHAVADLVVPIPETITAPAANDVRCQAHCGQPASTTCEARLIQTIQNAVAPESWQSAGGEGVLEYHPVGSTLVVHATPEVQEQVAQYLKALRQLQDDQISCEIRLVTVPGGEAVDQLLQCMHENRANGSCLFLSPYEVKNFLMAAETDKSTSITAAPKITAYNRQRCNIRCGDDHSFVTDLDPVKLTDGQTVMMPRNTRVFLGYDISFQPSLSSDRRSIQCDFQAELTQLADPQVPLLPVTNMITPVFEGGAQGVPVPFTQFIQQPRVQRRSVHTALNVPDGQTMMLYAGKQDRMVSTRYEDDYPPLFCWVPFVMELLSAPVEPTRVEDHLFIMVTPRLLKENSEIVVRAYGEESQAPAAPAPYPSCPNAASPACPGCPAKAACEGCPAKAACEGCPKAGACEGCPAKVAKAKAEKGCEPAARGEAKSNTLVLCDVSLVHMESQLVQRYFPNLVGSCAAGRCGGGSECVRAEEAQAFVAAVASSKSSRLVCRPQIATRENQAASMITGEHRTTVTGFQIGEDESGCAPRFQEEYHLVGCELFLYSTIAEDGQSIRMALEGVLNLAEPKGKAYSVAIQAEDESEPTQFVMQKAVTRVYKADTAMEIPANKTLVLHLGRDHAGFDYVVLAQPRLTTVEALQGGEASSVPAPTGGETPGKLDRLLKRYQQACAAGDTELARKLARRCLALDPTCFGK